MAKRVKMDPFLNKKSGESVLGLASNLIRAQNFTTPHEVTKMLKLADELIQIRNNTQLSLNDKNRIYEKVLQAFREIQTKIIRQGLNTDNNDGDHQRYNKISEEELQKRRIREMIREELTNTFNQLQHQQQQQQQHQYQESDQEEEEFSSAQQSPFQDVLLTKEEEPQQNQATTAGSTTKHETVQHTPKIKQKRKNVSPKTDPQEQEDPENSLPSTVATTSMTTPKQQQQPERKQTLSDSGRKIFTGILEAQGTKWVKDKVFLTTPKVPHNPNLNQRPTGYKSNSFDKIINYLASYETSKTIPTSLNRLLETVYHHIKTGSPNFSVLLKKYPNLSATHKKFNPVDFENWFTDD
jgi:hypothetical protein